MFLRHQLRQHGQTCDRTIVELWRHQTMIKLSSLLRGVLVRVDRGLASGLFIFRIARTASDVLGEGNRLLLVHGGDALGVQLRFGHVGVRLHRLGLQALVLVQVTLKLLEHCSLVEEALVLSLVPFFHLGRKLQGEPQTPPALEVFDVLLDLLVCLIHLPLKWRGLLPLRLRTCLQIYSGARTGLIMRRKLVLVYFMLCLFHASGILEFLRRRGHERHVLSNRRSVVQALRRSHAL